MFKVKNKLIFNWRTVSKSVADFLWRRQTLYAVLLFLLLITLIFNLSIIPDKSAQSEVDYIQTNSVFSNIADNPLYLPHKLTTFAVEQISSSVRFVRAISIVFFGICTVALYRVLKRWHSDKVALFSSAMFATNAVVLAVARLGSPDVLLFSWAIVISLLLWLRYGTSRRIAPLTLALIGTAIVYIPGAPYFFALLIALFANKIKSTFQNMKRSSFYVSICLGLLALTPLILSFLADPNLIKSWLLLPENIIFSEIPRRILEVPSAFIYRTPEYPLLNVGRLPIFDVASGGLFLIGLYAYQKYIKLERTKIMILTAILGLILGALGQTLIAILILLPFTYSIIGAGISYVLDEWYRVFPKNPFARSFGLILVTLVILMSVYYQLTRFLVVWVNAPETRDVYNYSRIIE